MKHYSFNEEINCNLAITEMHPRTPWELVAYPLESAQHTSGTAVLTYTAHYTPDVLHTPIFNSEVRGYSLFRNALGTSM
jgi:hypothetical protein